jgi:hypothetical protein
MGRAAWAAIGGVIGLVVALGLMMIAGIAVYALGEGHATRKPELLVEECGPVADGGQWCVQRRDERGEHDELWFVRRVDGEDLPRTTYAAYPFHNDGLRVTFQADSITVFGNDGARAVFPEKFYELD